ncbi:MAG: cupin domain-containing protein [Paracoccaceae bacterium]
MGAGGRIVKGPEWMRAAGIWSGRIEGRDLGTGMTVLFYASEEDDPGVPLHVHDYDELFVIREGRALFTVGGEEIEAEAGDVVFGPARVPHKFRNLGPGRLETTDIHLSERFEQTLLDDPDAR